MNLNSIPSFYWKKICNIKSFDLIKRKYRFITILFWMFFIITIGLIGFFYNDYIIDRDEQKYNEEIIDDFIANFALNRFFEDLREDVKEVNGYLTTEKGYITKYYKKKFIPEGYSVADISNLINKLSLKIIFRESRSNYFSGKEEKLFEKVAEKLGYDKYAHLPNNYITQNIYVLTNFCDEFYSSNPSFIDENFHDAYFELQHKSFLLAKSTLATDKYYTDGITYSWKTRDSTKFHYISDWDKLSTINKFQISKSLPQMYQIDFYNEKYKNNFKNEGVNYFPNFLVAPFTELTFYNPIGFDPSQLSDNIQRARNENGTYEEIRDEFILYLSIVLISHLLFVFVIRIIVWVKNGV